MPLRATQSARLQGAGPRLREKEGTPRGGRRPEPPSRLSARRHSRQRAARVTVCLVSSLWLDFLFSYVTFLIEHFLHKESLPIFTREQGKIMTLLHWGVKDANSQPRSQAL